MPNELGAEILSRLLLQISDLCFAAHRVADVQKETEISGRILKASTVFSDWSKKVLVPEQAASAEDSAKS
jgi:hypothetical protein